MNTGNFSVTVLTSQTATEVFKAIANVRGWWSEEIEGPTEGLHAEFGYHFEDIHRCRMKIIHWEPDRKLAWQVMDNHFKPGLFHETPENEGDGTPAQDEWTGTRIVFEILPVQDGTKIIFTHFGLSSAFICFDTCVNGWNHYIGKSLAALISTGQGMPNKSGRPMTADEERFHDAEKKS